MVLKGYKSRAQFAKALNISVSTIHNMINGINAPSGTLINAIYKQLDLTPDELAKIFFGEDK